MLVGIKAFSLRFLVVGAAVFGVALSAVAGAADVDVLRGIFAPVFTKHEQSIMSFVEAKPLDNDKSSVEFVLNEKAGDASVPELNAWLTQKVKRVAVQLAVKGYEVFEVSAEDGGKVVMNVKHRDFDAIEPAAGIEALNIDIEPAAAPFKRPENFNQYSELNAASELLPEAEQLEASGERESIFEFVSRVSSEWFASVTGNLREYVVGNRSKEIKIHLPVDGMAED